MLMNNHKEHLALVMAELVRDFRKQKLIKWRQMKALELAAAVVAELLVLNGVDFDLATGKITWPSGHVSKPPKGKTKTGKSSGKSQKSSDALGLLFTNISEDLLAEEKREGKSKIGIYFNIFKKNIIV